MFTRPQFYDAATVKTGLIRLLSRLRAEDAPLLDGRGRSLLRYGLRHCERWSHRGHYDPTWVVAALAAVGAVGDREALPLVERLARLAQWKRL